MPLSDLIVRSAAVDDAAALAALHAEALPPGWPASDFEKYTRSNAAAVWCAYRDRNADLSGLCVVQTLPPEAEILTIGVSKAARRTGVGSALLNHAIEALSENGVNRIFLEVAESNAVAHRLYLRHGFCLFGRRKGYYQTSGVFADALIMRLDTGSSF